MARLVLKDNITSGGALAPGQTLRLGGFTMIARLAVEPTMTSRAIETFVDDTVELSMKAPMSVSKPVDLG